MEVKFPLFVKEKDCGIVTQYSSVFDMQYHFEKIDVENGEYQAWDSNGVPLSLIVQEPVWLRLDAASASQSAEELADAIRKYADSWEIKIDLSRLKREEFVSVLADVKDAIGRKVQAKSWWERFKNRF